MECEADKEARQCGGASAKSIGRINGIECTERLEDGTSRRMPVCFARAVVSARRKETAVSYQGGFGTENAPSWQVRKMRLPSGTTNDLESLVDMFWDVRDVVEPLGQASMIFPTSHVWQSGHGCKHSIIPSVQYEGKGV